MKQQTHLRVLKLSTFSANGPKLHLRWHEVYFQQIFFFPLLYLIFECVSWESFYHGISCKMGLKYILFSLKLYYSSMIFNMEIVEEAVMAYKKYI